MDIKKELEGFVEGLENLDMTSMPEDERAYFEGKKFAYECVLELIEQESK